MLCVIVVIWLLEIHILDLFRIASVNLLDGIAITAIPSLLTYSVIRPIAIGSCVYVTFALWSSLILFVFTSIRFIIHCIVLYRTEKKTSNLIDLADLYKGTLSQPVPRPILLAEKDVDYDLLEREGVTNQLYRSIIHCQPEQSYVISLEGEWGAGKTTIINNTKRLLRSDIHSTNDYILVDDFDPWLYGTQESLLLAMFESLVRHSGMRYSPSRSSRTIRTLRETVANSHWTGNLLHIIFHDIDSVTKLKHRISSYLRTNGKSIVFFIDNLDRATDENIIFLFKLIGIVFDLPRVIYVLSFERERINSVLKNTHEIDPRFTEKIIQQEIRVPTISAEKSQNLYSTCLINLLTAYGISGNEIKEFVPAAKYIIKKTKNIRMFKRMVNSVFPIVFCDNNLLKKSDLFAIEAIHFFDPELFYSIYNNPQFFISHEQDSVIALELGFNKDAFNKQGSEFFKHLFSTHADAIDLLSELFPYVERYKKGNTLKSTNLFSDPLAEQIKKESRICDGKYFDLYFSYSTNDYVVIRRDIESLISDMNSIAHTTDDVELKAVAQAIQNHLLSFKSDDHREWVERLQLHLSDIVQERMFSVAVALYTMINHFDHSGSMLGYGLDAHTRIEYIISELLLKCTEKEFEEFISIISKDYRQLRVIRSILQWMSSEKREQTEVRIKRSERLKMQFNNICRQILEQHINLYSDNNYYPKNTWGLYSYCKAHDDTESFSAYISKILSPASVYRILWDLTTTSIGDSYAYSISDENFRIYIIDADLADNLVKERPPQSKDEEFVFNVYEAFRRGKPDEWGEKRISSTTNRILQL